MLVKTTLSVSDKVYTASVAVEADTLEKQFFDAYGEPQIDLAGTIPYTPATPQQAPGQITLSSEADVGSPAASGSVEDVPALGDTAVEIKGSGTFPTDLTDTNGFYHYAPEVVGDFEFKARIDYVDGGMVDSGADPTINNGFRVGLALFNGDGSDDPSIIFGWGSHQSSFNIALWHRTAKGGAYSEINTIARSDYKGIYLRLTRESLTLKAEYSVDNGETWNLLATTTLQWQAYRVGLFANSGDTSLLNATLNYVSLTQTPVEDVNTFTIDGSPKLSYMRSQSPHVFYLDGKTVEEAEAKVAGWAATIELRLKAAKDNLFDSNASPSGSDTTVKQY